MSDSYTIVLWCADTSHLTAFAGAHLLQTGIDTVNRGRIGNAIPISVGVAVPRRRPIISREVSARGVLRARHPRITTSERFDYLLTFTSNHEVSLSNALRNTIDAPVIAVRDLIAALDSLSPNSMTQGEIVSSFNQVARTPIHAAAQSRTSDDMHEVAELCQELVAVLSR